MDELFKNLLSETKDLYNAARNADFEQIGVTLKSRGKLISMLQGINFDAGSRTESQQEIINQILEYDSKAKKKLKELRDSRGSEAADFSKKADGLLKYSKSIYNLSKGRILDKAD